MRRPRLQRGSDAWAIFGQLLQARGEAGFIVKTRARSEPWNLGRDLSPAPSCPGRPWPAEPQTRSHRSYPPGRCEPPPPGHPVLSLFSTPGARRGGNAAQPQRPRGPNAWQTGPIPVVDRVFWQNLTTWAGLNDTLATYRNVDQTGEASSAKMRGFGSTRWASTLASRVDAGDGNTRYWPLADSRAICGPFPRELVDFKGR